MTQIPLARPAGLGSIIFAAIRTAKGGNGACSGPNCIACWPALERGKLVIAIIDDEGYDDVPDRPFSFRDGKFVRIDIQECVE